MANFRDIFDAVSQTKLGKWDLESVRKVCLFVQDRCSLDNPQFQPSSRDEQEAKFRVLMEGSYLLILLASLIKERSFIMLVKETMANIVSHQLYDVQELLLLGDVLLLFLQRFSLSNGKPIKGAKFSLPLQDYSMNSIENIPNVDVELEQTESLSNLIEFYVEVVGQIISVDDLESFCRRQKEIAIYGYLHSWMPNLYCVPSFFMLENQCIIAAFELMTKITLNHNYNLSVGTIKQATTSHLNWIYTTISMMLQTSSKIDISLPELSQVRTCVGELLRKSGEKGESDLALVVFHQVSAIINDLVACGGDLWDLKLNSMVHFGIKESLSPFMAWRIEAIHILLELILQSAALLPDQSIQIKTIFTWCIDIKSSYICMLILSKIVLQNEVLLNALRENISSDSDLPTGIDIHGGKDYEGAQRIRKARFHDEQSQETLEGDMSVSEKTSPLKKKRMLAVAMTTQVSTDTPANTTASLSTVHLPRFNIVKAYNPIENELAVLVGRASNMDKVNEHSLEISLFEALVVWVLAVKASSTGTVSDQFRSSLIQKVLKILKSPSDFKEHGSKGSSGVWKGFCSWLVLCSIDAAVGCDSNNISFFLCEAKGLLSTALINVQQHANALFEKDSSILLRDLRKLGSFCTKTEFAPSVFLLHIWFRNVSFTFIDETFEIAPSGAMLAPTFHSLQLRYSISILMFMFLNSRGDFLMLCPAGAWDHLSTCLRKAFSGNETSIDVEIVESLSQLLGKMVEGVLTEIDSILKEELSSSLYQRYMELIKACTHGTTDALHTLLICSQVLDTTLLEKLSVEGFKRLKFLENISLLSEALFPFILKQVNFSHDALCSQQDSCEDDYMEYSYIGAYTTESSHKFDEKSVHIVNLLSVIELWRQLYVLQSSFFHVTQDRSTDTAVNQLSNRCQALCIKLTECCRSNFAVMNFSSSVIELYILEWSFYIAHSRQAETGQSFKSLSIFLESLPIHALTTIGRKETTSSYAKWVIAKAFISEPLPKLYPQIALWLLTQCIGIWQSVPIGDKTMHLLFKDFITNVSNNYDSLAMAMPSEIFDAILFPLVEYVSSKAKNVIDDQLLQSVVSLLGGKAFVNQNYGLLLSKLASKSESFIHRYTGYKLLCQVSSKRICLLEEHPRILFHLLISEENANQPLKSTLDGWLESKLLLLMRSFGFSSLTSEQGNRMSITLFHSVLLPVIWSLGRSAQSRDYGLKALQALSIMMVHKTWTISNRENNIGIDELAIQCTQEVLPHHFLFIISHLLQHHWYAQSPQHQEICLKSLDVLITVFDSLSLTRFLPKILIIVDEAFASPHAMVRLAATSITATLCSHLPREALLQSIVVLAIGLFPVVEMRTRRQSGPTAGPVATSESTIIEQSNTVVISSFVYDSFSAIKRGIQFETLLEGISAPIKNATAAAKAKEIAVDIMKTLFLGSQAIALSSLKELPLIPDVSELLDLRNTHADETKSLDFNQLMLHLVNKLHHENANVRETVIRKYTEIFRNEKQIIYDMISLSFLSSASSSSENTITTVLKELLQLSSREVDFSVKEELAKCLGALGAIDPAYMRITVLDRKEPGNVADTKARLLPWKTTSFEFAIEVLSSYIVPGLKSAHGSSSQDRSGYAIQELLRLLVGSDRSNKAQTSLTSSTQTKSMPRRLENALASKNILEVVTPFWASKYNMDENYIAKSAPIYVSGLPFNRWIFLWCRYLLTLCRGPLRQVFDACKGVMRYKVDLCQFLLPYMLLDILLFGSAESASMIQREIMLVLSDGKHSTGSSAMEENSIATDAAEASNFRPTQSNNQICVQCIFSVLDTYSTWISFDNKVLEASSSTTASAVSSSSAASASASASAAAPVDIESITYGSSEDVAKGVNQLLNSLPKQLLCTAALSIKAYARSLRYLELSARQRVQSERSGGNAKAPGELAMVTSVPQKVNDHASGELPRLTGREISMLTEIFSVLEDVDSLQGANAILRINGYTEAPIHKIMELEQSDDWLSALLEYELIQNSPHYIQSLDRLQRRPLRTPLIDSAASGESFDSSELLIKKARIITPSKRIARLDSIITHDRRKSRGFRANDKAEMMSSPVPRPVPRSETREALLLQQQGATTKQSAEITIDNACAVERGKVRCLIELGHLESAIYHVMGKSDSVDQIKLSLLPLGAEASWRLSKWDELHGFLSEADSLSNKVSDVGTAAGSITSALFSETESYRLRLCKALYALNNRDEGTFRMEISTARAQTMSSLAAASMESYSRCYPLLVRLHALSELELGGELLKLNVAGDEVQTFRDREEILLAHSWEQRVRFLPDSMIYKSQIMAIRRAILNICKMPSLVSVNWLELSDLYRQLGRYDSARSALKQAEQFGSDREIILLEECKILREQGQLQRALNLLEPTPLDIEAITKAVIEMRTGRKKTTQVPTYLDTDEKKINLAKRIHLATQLMVDSEQSHGAIITDRYRLVTTLHKTWDESFFDMGRYYEFLYQDSMKREHKKDGSDLSSGKIDDAAANASLGRGSSSSSAAQASTSDARHSFNYLEKAIEKYGNCLLLGTSTDAMIMQVLPRLLTLWLTFTSLSDSSDAKAAQAASAVLTSSVGAKKSSKDATSSSSSPSTLQIYQGKVNDKMRIFVRDIGANIWFHGIQQIVSRVLHRNPTTVEILVEIITKVLTAYPKQSIWHIGSLIHSLNSERKNVAKKVMQEAHGVLKYSNPEDANMIIEASKLFSSLVNLAEFQTKEKKVKWVPDGKVKLQRFLVPSQSVLLQCNPMQSSSIAASASTVHRIVTNGTEGMLFINKFNETVDVASSKAKPKTITLETTCGKVVKFLCKQEKDGDLRKDARMMEFNNVVNRLFQQDPQGRKRKLRLRTYAVVCLNEECGLLEWVNNTECLRQVITQAHSYSPPALYPNITYKELYHAFIDFQTKHEDDISKMTQEYLNLLEKHNYHPCFHRWFLEKFTDPTEWLEARNTYTRSVAVWSGVGHVIGLGDRHTENILIDVKSGECVHVDFDCLFDKGLTLLRPEIIPFRLTSNMVDAMGVTGIEGSYRKTLEVCMKLLRESKETLLGVLEPFLRDPTVSWSRSGRAQRSESSVSVKGAIATVHDNENKEAKEMLMKIGDRLKGVYNIAHPQRDKFVRAYNRRGQQLPHRGLGAGKDEFLPLSVQGQTQRLIDEATCIENLSQLYIGWQPWI